MGLSRVSRGTRAVCRGSSIRDDDGVDEVDGVDVGVDVDVDVDRECAPSGGTKGAEAGTAKGKGDWGLPSVGSRYNRFDASDVVSDARDRVFFAIVGVKGGW